MTKGVPTKTAQLLIDELRKHDIEVIPEHWDKHKHVDVAVPSAKLYIEVDEMHHFLRPKQIISDFSRDYYSNQSEISTFRVPSIVVEQYLDKVVRAILKVIEIKKAEILEKSQKPQNISQ